MIKEFRFDDENTRIQWYFQITGPDLTDSDYDNLIDNLQDWLDENELEYKYGIHDCCGDDSPMDLVSFQSYEIDESEFPKLMDKWKEFWKSQGYTTGPTLQREAQ